MMEAMASMVARSPEPAEPAAFRRLEDQIQKLQVDLRQSQDHFDREEQRARRAQQENEDLRQQLRSQQQDQQEILRTMNQQQAEWQKQLYSFRSDLESSRKNPGAVSDPTPSASSDATVRLP